MKTNSTTSGPARSLDTAKLGLEKLALAKLGLEKVGLGKLDPGKLDRAGATASLACAIHCAVLPFVVTLLPVYGLSFLAGETVEWILVGIAIALAAVSLLLGYRRHRSVRVLSMLSAAVVLLLAGRLAEHQTGSLNGTFLAVAGGLVLVGAHVLNYRLCKSCRRCTDGCSTAS